MKFDTTHRDSGLESALAHQDWPQLVKVSRKLLRKKRTTYKHIDILVLHYTSCMMMMPQWRHSQKLSAFGQTMLSYS